MSKLSIQYSYSLGISCYEKGSVAIGMHSFLITGNSLGHTHPLVLGPAPFTLLGWVW